jgi:hypothetical protein
MERILRLERTKRPTCSWLQMQRTARDATVQAKDLGGFGKVLGGMPGKGGTCRITNRTGALKNGSQYASAARAAPQQAIPAALPQQWLAQSVGTIPAFGCAVVALTATTPRATDWATVGAPGVAASGGDAVAFAAV